MNVQELTKGEVKQRHNRTQVDNQNDGDCECGNAGGCWESEFMAAMFVGQVKQNS